MQPAEELCPILRSRLHIPDPARAAHTAAGSVEKFQQLLKDSYDNPDSLWASVASELDWMKPWDTVRKGEFPRFEFFSGGISNVCWNLLDRPLRAGADNRLALIWEGENFDTRFFTYRMLYHEVNKFANVLKSLGLRKSDPVALFLPNLPETFIAVLACFRLGLVFNTVFSGFSAAALRTRLQHFEPRVVITADGSYRRGKVVPLKEKVDEAIANLHCVQKVIVVRRVGIPVHEQTGRDYWWDELIRPASIECEPEPVEANEPGLVFYTSGTTGKPKGVVHSGLAFLVNNYVYAKYHMDHHPHDVLWCTADIGWLTMLIWGVVGALANQVTTVFCEGSLDFPSPARFYQTVHRYRINKVFTAPTAIRMLMRHGEGLMQGWDLSCLEVIALVGEPLNPEAWHWMDQKLGRSRIYINNTWGQTELAGCPLSGAAWLTPMKPGSSGIQFLGAKMDIVDESGHSLPANTVGNLVLREPIPMAIRGLWREPERFVAEYFKRVPGCYFTYDAAIRDDDGHYWVIGRLDDVINVAGHRLSTMEMESAIMECEDVAEVAVVGVPDAIKGLVPVAFVTLRAGCQPSDQQRARIREQVETTISKIASPQSIYFTDAMPKTPSGKIMRRMLREIVTTGQVKGDTTGLEDSQSLDQIRSLVRGT